MNDLNGGKTRSRKARKVREVIPDDLASRRALNQVMSQYDEAIVLGPARAETWQFPERYNVLSEQLVGVASPPWALHWNCRHLFEAMERYNDWHFKHQSENVALMGRACIQLFELCMFSRMLRSRSNPRRVPDREVGAPFHHGALFDTNALKAAAQTSAQGSGGGWTTASVKPRTEQASTAQVRSNPRRPSGGRRGHSVLTFGCRTGGLHHAAASLVGGRRQREHQQRRRRRRG
jgi:hypothetical protein